MKTRLALAMAMAALVAGCGGGSGNGGEDGDQLKIGVLPKLVGIGFFNAVERGALEAGEDLGVEVVYDGPTEADVTKQMRLVDTWIGQRFDAIAVAPNNPDAIAPVLKKAQGRGITVVAYDADAAKDARAFFVNQATAASIAKALVDVMAEGAGPDARYLIITGSLTADNQNQWIDEMETYMAEAYPEMTAVSELPKAPGEDQAAATQVTLDALKTYDDLDGIFAITSVALPGAAEALQKEDAADDVFLTGLATPNDMREYVEDGTVKKFVLWSPVDLGYLAVHVAKAAQEGRLEPGAESFEAGRLGEVEVRGDVVILGDPIVFTPENINDYDF